MIKKYGPYVLKALLTLAFGAAGLAKLAGAEAMVATFDAVGVGQWFRYGTGVVEVGAAVFLWVRGYQFFAAAVMVATMIGAILTHLFILGPSAVPALVLGIIAAIVAYSHRDQNPLSS